MTHVTARAVEALRALLPEASDPAEGSRLTRALAVLEGDGAVPTVGTGPSSPDTRGVSTADTAPEDDPAR